MSVLIKNMSMPKSCVSCRWYKRWGCEIADIVTDETQSCPLVEVSTPHGRLIDTEELLERIEKYLNNVPAIIEAEKEEKE